MKCAAGPNANATTCPPPTVTAIFDEDDTAVQATVS